MKSPYLLLSLLFSLIINACSQETPATQALTSAPTLTSNIINSNELGGIQASGEVIPAKYTEMGFIQSAQVKKILVTADDEVLAGQILVVQDVPELEYAVVAAKAGVESAESFARLQRFRRTILNQKGKTLYLTGPHEVLEIADAKVVQAQAALEKAQAELALSRLIAPYAGTVVEVRASEGEFMPVGEPVIILADLTEFQVETKDLNERDVSRLHFGQGVEIYVPALDVTQPGKISQISPRAEFVDGDVVYKIVINFDHQPDGLLWGMSGDVLFKDK